MTVVPVQLLYGYSVLAVLGAPAVLKREAESNQFEKATSLWQRGT